MIFDDWQQELISYKGSATLRSGRQVGKSTTVGRRCAKLMLEYPKTSSLIIAPSQRQSGQLFIKTMGWLMKEHHRLIEAAGGWKDRGDVSARRNMELRRLFEHDKGLFAESPTKSMVTLKNGSICYSLPAGKTGIYLRTFALDFLYIDEAAYVPDSVYKALKPMLAVSSSKGLGWECFLSTPFGKGGFFYDSFSDDDYKQFHVNSEDCTRIPKAFLMKEKKKLSKIEYAQEYLGEFTDEFRQFFPTSLIKKRMTFIRWNYKEDYKKSAKYFLGVDFARYGEDENAFIEGEMLGGKAFRIIGVETSERKSLTDTVGRIMAKNEQMNYNKIFVDDGGLGAGATDMLIEQLGRKVIGLNNAKKTIDHEAVRTNKIFKEDLYSNASMMMEKDGQIDIISDLKLLRSLKSMTFEYTSDRNLRIYGKYSHLAEAFVRACWAVKKKGLSLYVF